MKKTEGFGPPQKIDVFQHAAILQEVFADPSMDHVNPEVPLDELTGRLSVKLIDFKGCDKKSFRLQAIKGAMIDLRNTGLGNVLYDSQFVK